MKTVWVMNLKDNRTDIPKAQKGNEKFDKCKDNGIIAIGWEWETPGCGVRAYETAHRFMAELQRGDLVWVRDKHTGNRYLCEVQDDEMTDYRKDSSKKMLIDTDIVEVRKCKYHDVPAGAELPKRSKLVARQTIQHMRDQEAIAATWKLFKHLTAGEKK